MRLQTPSSKLQIPEKLQTPIVKPLGQFYGRKIWILAGVTVALAPMVLLANTNYSGAEEIPKLRPPRGEIAPTFWERRGQWVVAGSAAAVAVMGAGIWFLTRPRAAMVVPPEVRARQELERLRGRTEDGALLSKVSQALRRYVAAAFELPPGELTTSEFCRVIAGEERIGPELADAMGAFLRCCDERKFTPPAPRPELGAAEQALKLFEAAEVRRELRAMEQAKA